jgi:hypothetical protein
LSQQLLHIRGASANAGIRLQSDGGSGDTYEIRSLTNGVLTVGTTLANVLNVTPSNVGIGTTSPGLVSGMSKYLTLASTGSGEAVGLELVGNRSSGGQTTARISFINSSAEIARINCSYQDSTTLGSLEFYTSGSEKARIDSAGRLLVGTTTARSNFFNSTISALLQVEGASSAGDPASRFIAQIYGRNNNDDPIYIFAKHRGTTVGGNTIVSSDDNLGLITFQGSDGSQFVDAAQIRAAVDGTPSANAMPGRLVFSTTAAGASAATERLRITKEGNVYFGNAISSTPWTKTSGNSTMSWIEDTGSVGGALAIANNADRGFSGMYINKFAYTSGDDDRFADWRLNGGSAIGTITINATSNGVNYNTTSDYRLKENVVALTDGIDRLKKLNVNRFNFIGSTLVVDGFIAHEVQDVVPEAISGAKDAVDNEGNPKYQGIDQSKLVPLLTAALQEAIAKIETLEQRLSDAGIA